MAAMKKHFKDKPNVGQLLQCSTNKRWHVAEANLPKGLVLKTNYQLIIKESFFLNNLQSGSVFLMGIAIEVGEKLNAAIDYVKGVARATGETHPRPCTASDSSETYTRVYTYIINI